MARLFQFLFGCHHTRLSWPFRQTHKLPTRYQVCLECGEEIEYTGELQ